MIIRYDCLVPEESSVSPVSRARSPKDVQNPELDDVDRRILLTLHRDARMPNSALADAVGIAPSTCHGRVRRLHDLGCIRGDYADMHSPATRLALAAMISG